MSKSDWPTATAFIVLILSLTSCTMYLADARDRVARAEIAAEVERGK